jgi:hypothetical protein
VNGIIGRAPGIGAGPERRATSPEDRESARYRCPGQPGPDARGESRDRIGDAGCSFAQHLSIQLTNDNMAIAGRFGARKNCALCPLFLATRAGFGNATHMGMRRAQLISDLGLSLDETPPRPRPVTLIEGVDDALITSYREHAALIVAGWRWSEPVHEKWTRWIRDFMRDLACALRTALG